MSDYVMNILFGAFTIIGIVQWVKNFPIVKKIPGWGLSLIQLVLALPVAYVFFVLPVWAGALLVMFVCSQVFYETIFQVIEKLLLNMAGKNEK